LRFTSDPYIWEPDSTSDFHSYPNRWIGHPALTQPKTRLWVVHHTLDENVAPSHYESNVRKSTYLMSAHPRRLGSAPGTGGTARRADGEWNGWGSKRGRCVQAPTRQTFRLGLVRLHSAFPPHIPTPRPKFRSNLHSKVV